MSKSSSLGSCHIPDYLDLWIIICQINLLAYTAACETVWATDVLLLILVFLSVDGITCHIDLRLKNDLSNGVWHKQIVSIFKVINRFVPLSSQKKNSMPKG
jgi:hypothetical protein